MDFEIHVSVKVPQSVQQFLEDVQNAIMALLVANGVDPHTIVAGLSFKKEEEN